MILPIWDQKVVTKLKIHVKQYYTFVINNLSIRAPSISTTSISKFNQRNFSPSRDILQQVENQTTQGVVFIIGI